MSRVRFCPARISPAKKSAPPYDFYNCSQGRLHLHFPKTVMATPQKISGVMDSKSADHLQSMLAVWRNSMQVLSEPAIYTLPSNPSIDEYITPYMKVSLAPEYI